MDHRMYTIASDNLFFAVLKRALMENFCVEKKFDEYTKKERDNVNIHDLLLILLDVYSNGDYIIKNIDYYKNKYMRKEPLGNLVRIEEKESEVPIEVPAEMPVNPITDKPKRNHKKKDTAEKIVDELNKVEDEEDIAKQ